jgi:hypothetical protein
MINHYKTHIKISVIRTHMHIFPITGEIIHMYRISIKLGAHLLKELDLHLSCNQVKLKLPDRKKEYLSSVWTCYYACMSAQFRAPCRHYKFWVKLSAQSLRLAAQLSKFRTSRFLVRIPFRTWVYTRASLCCAVLCRQRPCYGPSICPRSNVKVLRTRTLLLILFNRFPGRHEYKTHHVKRNVKQ